MRHRGKRIMLEGAVTMDTVPGLLPGALAAMRAGADTLDFGGTTLVDSAAIALALELRRASRGGIALDNLPPTALNLARLYSVADQLGIPG